ncbi:MAG: iron-sulfur cluster assembly scaffold protein, partial [Geminicoccaceae bacterium]
LYQEAIIALAKKARGLSRLETPDRTATIDNPLCGDRVTLDLGLDGQRVIDVGHRTRGCLLCEAASFLIADHVVGLDVETLAAKAPHVATGVGDDAIAMADLWPGLETLAPVRRFKSRHECVTLPFQALIKALENKG